MTRAEDRANQKITRQFIRTFPSYIVLTPYTKREDDAGGWSYEKGKDRPEQMVRLVDPYSPAPMQRTIDGFEYAVNLEVMAESSAWVEVHDRFVKDGIDYEITSIWNNDWGAIRSWAVRRG